MPYLVSYSFYVRCTIKYCTRLVFMYEECVGLASGIDKEGAIVVPVSAVSLAEVNTPEPHP